MDGIYIVLFGCYGSENGQLKSLNYLVVIQDNGCLVIDIENNCIVKFDCSGKFEFIFGGKGSEKGQFDCFGGIVVDFEGFIIVGDF